jgi:hypothetical protein
VKLKIVAALAAACALAAPVLAQGLPTTVPGKLAFMAEGLDMRALSRSRNGRLRQGETATVTLPVTQAGYLTVIGACAGSCTRLDLTVLGEAEQLLSERRNEYADAVHEILPPPGTKNVTVKVTMHTCPTGRCTWGVNIYGRANVVTPGPSPAPAPR